MKAKRFLRMMFALSLALLMATTALADIETVETVTEFGRVAYPVITDYADELQQVNANLKILEIAQVEKHLSALQRQTASGWGMDAGFSGMLKADMLSLVFSVRGDLGNQETQQRYDVLNLDLKTGKEITLSDLFKDGDAALQFMQSVMETDVAPQLSGYVANEEVVPLPLERFSFDEYGITLHYEGEQFMMLSGFAGTASFFYYELEPFLNLEEGSVLSRLGVSESLLVSKDSAAQIAKAVEAGTLPGVYAKLGDALADIFKVQRLFCDPDFYPNARFFQLEAGEMRDILLLAPLEKRSYEETFVTGIRADRLSFYGIRVGESTRNMWRELLGEPDETVDLDAYTASDFYLSQGMDDYYIYGENRLRFHANEEGILESLQILLGGN
jgi:Protein of unknown function (DUF3298).